MFLSKNSLPPEAPLRVGVWFETNPGQGFSHEGLVRLLTLIINNSDARQVRFCLAAPHWLTKTLKEYVAEEIVQKKNEKAYVMPANKAQSWLTQHIFKKARISSSPMIAWRRLAKNMVYGFYDLVFNRRHMISSIIL